MRYLIFVKHSSTWLSCTALSPTAFFRQTHDIFPNSRYSLNRLQREVNIPFRSGSFKCLQSPLWPLSFQPASWQSCTISVSYSDTKTRQGKERGFLLCCNTTWDCTLNTSTSLWPCHSLGTSWCHSGPLRIAGLCRSRPTSLWEVVERSIKIC